MFEDAIAKKFMVFLSTKPGIVLVVVGYECFWFFGRFILGVDSGKFFKGGFGGFFLFLYVIQHCVVCHPSESAVSEDAGLNLNPGLLQG
jgi:hypothetical protein